MSVWSGLIVTRVLALTEGAVETGVECDRLLEESDGPRLELAEPLAMALAVQGIGVPTDDARLLKWLSARPTTSVPVNLKSRGLVLFLEDGRLGLSGGSGVVIESGGSGLVVVRTPETGRYTEARIVPGVTVLGGGV